jgi:predicted PhzF superfamily epimerase YddE/YHI9
MRDSSSGKTSARIRRLAAPPDRSAVISSITTRRGSSRWTGVYKFGIEQGDFINRPSRLGLEVKGAPEKLKEVRVSGESVVVARGVLEF